MSNKVYLETTIPSYLAAKPARDLLQAARQQLTHDWWDQERAKYELFIAQVVVNEISAGDPDAAKRRLAIVAGIPLLETTEDISELAQELLDSRVVPAKAARDALHIAVAAIHEMDYLLTWNCRHIANAHIMKEIAAIVQNFGCEMPQICTPEELLGGSVDGHDS